MRYRSTIPALALISGLALPDDISAEADAAEPVPGDSRTPARHLRSQADEDCDRGGPGIISASRVSAQRLIGTRVTNPINEEIGEVSDLMLDQCGRIEVMIVHVGGFMGLGGRQVHMELEKVWIRAPEPEESSEMIIMVRETREHILNQGDAAARASGVAD